MDPLSLDILKAFILEEASNEGGITTYRIMRKLNLYPSFIYKLIRKLESGGYVECTNRNKGRVCRVTILGMFEVYRRDSSMQIYIEKLLSRHLNVRDVENLRRVIQMLLGNDLAPRSYAEFLGYLLMFYHVPEARRLLREVASGLGAQFIISPGLVYVKVNGSTYLSCEKNCDICSFRPIVCVV